ncbi:MAG: hypothetical protein Kow00121_24960 [Elainellaceae cyanobacterium]
MTRLQRTSPIYGQIQSLTGKWQTLNDMPVLTACLDEQARLSHLGIADLSCLARFGVKGASAADWLHSQGLPTPDRPNSWLDLPEGGLIARLGLTEFLIEDSIQSTIAASLSQACQSPPAKVYPVLRQDLALALWGEAVPDLLRQTCNINFAALTLSDRPVVLTSMIGVAVTVIPNQRSDRPFYRIWCDGTFGTYVWRTLLAIAEELGGGAVGTDAFLKID